MSRAVQVLKAALEVAETDTGIYSDEAQDILKLLKRLPREYRLLLLTLASGVTTSTLKRYYAGDVFVILAKAVKMFDKLLEDYKKELLAC